MKLFMLVYKYIKMVVKIFLNYSDNSHAVVSEDFAPLKPLEKFRQEIIKDKLQGSYNSKLLVDVNPTKGWLIQHSKLEEFFDYLSQWKITSHTIEDFSRKKKLENKKERQKQRINLKEWEKWQNITNYPNSYNCWTVSDPKYTLGNKCDITLPDEKKFHQVCVYFEKNININWCILEIKNSEIQNEILALNNFKYFDCFHKNKTSSRFSFTRMYSVSCIFGFDGAIFTRNLSIPKRHRIKNGVLII